MLAARDQEEALDARVFAELDIEQGTYPDVERIFLVVGCQHCAEPPCVPVCPSGATRQRADGLVTMDYDTCIGCAYCAVACPYQARTIVDAKEFYYGEPSKQELANYPDQRLGVANKCTFCVERIDDAEASGLVPGIDQAATPACADACIASAIQFGDFADPNSNVSRLVAENQYFQMHAELGTDPQIKYLYEVPATTPGREADPEDLDDASLSDPENPLVGPLQTWWDYKAAMNFCLGGLASGLMLAIYALYLLNHAIPDTVLRGTYVAGAAVMGVGLVFVFLKIKRRLRALNVLLRPGSSWMTRETWCVAVLYPAILADLLWPHAALHGLVAAAAAGFLVSQAMILYRARGIPAWRAPPVPWMLGASGLLEGLGLIYLAAAVAHPDLGDRAALALGGIAAALTLFNAGLWQAYRQTAKARGIPPLARAEIARISRLLVWLGQVAPLLLFLAATVAGGSLGTACLGLGGALAAAGGGYWKFRLITRAGYFQGFALPRLPRRGSGRRAPPPRAGMPAAA